MLLCNFSSLLRKVSDLEITPFYIDLRRISRLEQFNEALLEYAYSKIGVTGVIKQLSNNLMTFLKTHRTTLKINVEILETTVELFAQENSTVFDYFANTLSIAHQIAKESNQHFYMVLDEFQDIKRFSSKEIDLLELMRAEIQHHSNITYVFLGSHMSIMTEIFENKKSPFFNFTRKLQMKPFELEELNDQILTAFKTLRVIFADDNDLCELLEKLGGHPANTMLVMQNIENIVKRDNVEVITQELIIKAYEDAYDELTDLFVEYLRDIQTKEHLHDVMYRLAKDEKQLLDSKLIYHKYSLLLEMGYIQKVEKGHYQIIDSLFKKFLCEV